MKLLLRLALVLVLTLRFASAQEHVPTPVPSTLLHCPSTNIPMAILPEFNWDSINKDIVKSDINKDGGVWGKVNEIKLDLISQGYQSHLPEGTIYRYSFHLNGAYSLMVIFDSLVITEGTELYLYNEDKSMKVGALTYLNNPTGGIYPTLPLSGDVITLEYFVPTGLSPGLVHVGEVVGDFVDIYKITVVDKSVEIDICTDNAVCRSSIPYYEDMVNSSGLFLSPRLTGGMNYYGFCSGTMLNNSKRDGTPYFSTSCHCINFVPGNSLSALKLEELPSCLFIFNFQTAACSDYKPDPSTLHGLAGAEILSYDPDVLGHNGGDYLLLKIKEKPILSHRICYSGWDATDRDNISSSIRKVGVHHPNGFTKRISTTSYEIKTVDLTSPETSGFNQKVLNKFWLTDQDKFYFVTWDGNGVTMEGSSGSGLFVDGKYVGNLNAGFSMCNENPQNGKGPNSPDRYGRFSANFVNGSMRQYLAPDWNDIDLAENSYQLGTYCPYKEANPLCLNGVLDVGETTIDCGGSCPNCTNFGDAQLVPTKYIIFDNESIDVAIQKNFSGPEYSYVWRTGYHSNYQPATETWDPESSLKNLHYYAGTNGSENINVLIKKGNDQILNLKGTILIGAQEEEIALDFSVEKKMMYTEEYIQLDAIIDALALASRKLSYEWDFGEGAICGPSEKFKASPRVSWKQSGSKTISLTVFYDNDGKPKTVDRVVKEGAVYVMMGIPSDWKDQYKFTTSFYCPSKINKHQSFKFHPNPLGDPPKSPTYEWNFGDGTISTVADALHSYLDAGTYTVTLKICDGTYCDSKSKSITVINPNPSADFLINGNPWNSPNEILYPDEEQNDPPVEVGYNTPVWVSNARMRPDGWQCQWEMDYPDQSNKYSLTGCQPINERGMVGHEVFYHAPGLYSVAMKEITPEGPINTVIKPGCIKVITGTGPWNCEGHVDHVTLSSTCWVGESLTLNVEISGRCKIDYRIIGSKRGNFGVNYNKIDYLTPNTIFPYQETFTVQALHYDGEKYTVMHERKFDFRITSGYPGIPTSSSVCPGTTVQLGIASMAGKQYAWSCYPASGMAYLSSAEISNPVVTATSAGNFVYTFSVKDLATGCLGTSTSTVRVSPVAVPSRQHEVSRGETVQLSAAATGGAQSPYTYLWTPANLLSSSAISNPVFTGTTTPGNYVYTLVASDANGCQGTARQEVKVSATAPSGLISNSTSSQLMITWVDNSSTETSFVLYRSSSLNGTYSIYATLPPNTESYIDVNTVFGVEYFYRVQAMENTRNLGYSNKARAIKEFESLPAISLGNFKLTKVLPLEDGGYLVGGSKNNDYYVRRISGCGEMLWEKTFTSNWEDYLTDIVSSPDGGFVLAGSSNGNNSNDRSQTNGYCKCTSKCTGYLANIFFDYWIIKIDANGVKQWDKSYRGYGKDMLSTIIPSRDGGYILGGTSESYDVNFYGTSCLERKSNGVNGDDFWIIKIENDGTLVWEKIIGSANEETVVKLMELEDRSILIAGNIWNRGLHDGFVNSNLTGDRKGRNFGWVVKCNQNGQILWDKSFGGPSLLESGQAGIGTDVVVLTDLEYTSSGKFKLLAAVNSALGNEITLPGRGAGDYWVFELDDQFNTTRSYRFGGTSGDNPIKLNAKDGGLETLYGFSNSGVSGDKTLGIQGLWVVETNTDGTKKRDVGISMPLMGGYPADLIDVFEPAVGLYHVFYRAPQGTVPVFQMYSDPDNFKALRTGNVYPYSYYWGDNLTVPFTAKGCIKSTNVYTLQLSDADGSFDAPTVLATMPSGAMSGIFNVSIPYSIPPGKAYRVRVVSSDLNYIGNDNGNYLTIQAPEIITNNITPLDYFPGASVVVPFSTRGNFQSNNTFLVQLSDKDGSFSNPTVLGNYPGSAVGSVNAVIPANTPWGTGYRIRVVSTAPVINGMDNGTDIRIGALFTENPVKQQYFIGEQMTVPYTAIGSFTSGNVFTLQLSDAQGNFANPIVLGIANSTVSGSISAIIPLTVTAGVGYKVRVVASTPGIIGMPNDLPITIETQRATVLPITIKKYIGGDQITIPYELLGVFNSTNLVSFQLSTVSGSFVSHITIGGAISNSSGSVTLTLPTFLLPGEHYRVRIACTSPALIGGDNGEDLEISTLRVGTISPVTYASGQSISIPIQTNYVYAPDNIFVAELSSREGSFDHPVELGRMPASGATTILGTIPFSTEAGNQYRVRVYATSPTMYSNASDEQLTIGLPGLILHQVAGLGLCRTNPVAVSYATTSNFAADNSFSLQISDASGSFDGQSTVGIFPGTTTGTIESYVSDTKLVGSGAYKMRIVSSNPFVISNEMPVELVNAAVQSDQGHVLCAGSTVNLSTFVPAGHTAHWYKDGVLVSSNQSTYQATSAGVYKVSLTNSSCTRMSLDFPIREFTQPTLTLSSATSTLCDISNNISTVEWRALTATTVAADPTVITSGTVNGTATGLTYLIGDGELSYVVKGEESMILATSELQYNGGTINLAHQRYAWNVFNGKAQIYVNFVPLSSDITVTVAAGDKLSIQRTGTTVVFKINEIVRHTLLGQTTLNWYVNVWLRANKTLSDVMLKKITPVTLNVSVAGMNSDYHLRWYNTQGTLAENVVSWSGFPSKNNPVSVVLTSQQACANNLIKTFVPVYLPKPTATATVQITPSPEICVAKDYVPASADWQNITGLVCSTAVQKSGSTNAWDTGAQLKESCTSKSYVETTLPNTPLALGLRIAGTFTGFTTMDYAWVKASDNTLGVYESGNKVFTVTNFALGDVVSIGMESSSVVYYHKGIKVYTSVKAIPGIMYPSLSLHQSNSAAVVKVLKNRSLLTFALNNTPAGTYAWHLNNTSVSTSTTWSSALLKGADKVKVVYSNTNACENTILERFPITISERFDQPIISISLKTNSASEVCKGPAYKLPTYINLSNVAVVNGGLLHNNTSALGGGYSQEQIKPGGGIYYKIHELEG
ncbi:MAG: PKD domain-containing protein, partial [Cytophagaceae bacterium]|nr:PKD domain-containing protein [Cytophagaceae bacterium]